MNLREQIERIEARAKSESEKKRERSAELRSIDPEWTARIDDNYKWFGKPNAVVVNGERFGKAPIERVCPPIPGVGNPRLPAKQSWVKPGKDRGLRERKPSAYQRALEAAMRAGEGGEEGAQ